jgi:NADH:ubiquinone oxidoreductase subunit F (NADH-binding)
VSIERNSGWKSGIAYFAQKTDALVNLRVSTQLLHAPKNLVTDSAGGVAQVHVKVIIAGGFGGERLLTHAANEAPVNFVNLFGAQCYRSSPT